MEAETAAAAGGDRIVTVPNLLSLGRLFCVPLFLWLLFAQDSPLGAGMLLAGLGVTDWVDGWIARRFDQVSELGKVLDPTADRILLGVTVVALYVDDVVPALLFWPVVVREVAISAAVLVLAARGVARIDVLWVGKAGAFGLMFAFPFFLLSATDVGTPGVWEALGWGCAVPGVLFSYWAAAQYARRVPEALRERAGAEAG